MDIIFIHGAPGSGKSTIAQALHERLNSPWFEFGWIPEFRQKGDVTIPYEEEEQLSFENLSLVVNNYLKHGFRNIIITDLRDDIIRQARRRFARRQTLTVLLYSSDPELVKQRVLEPSRSSAYRDWEEALDLNRRYIERPETQHELRIDIVGRSVEAIVEAVLTYLNKLS